MIDRSLLKCLGAEELKSVLAFSLNSLNEGDVVLKTFVSNLLLLMYSPLLILKNFFNGPRGELFYQFFSLAYLSMTKFIESLLIFTAISKKRIFSVDQKAISMAGLSDFRASIMKTSLPVKSRKVYLNIFLPLLFNDNITGGSNLTFFKAFPSPDERLRESC